MRRFTVTRHFCLARRIKHSSSRRSVRVIRNVWVNKDYNNATYVFTPVCIKHNDNVIITMTLNSRFVVDFVSDGCPRVTWVFCLLFLGIFPKTAQPNSELNNKVVTSRALIRVEHFPVFIWTTQYIHHKNAREYRLG